MTLDSKVTVYELILLRMTALTKRIRVFNPTRKYDNSVWIKTIIDTGAGRTIINKKQLSFMEPVQIKEFCPDEKPSLVGAFSDNRSEVLGQVDLLLDIDNVFKNISAIVLNNANFCLILGFPDIVRLGLQIIGGEVFTRERRIFGQNIPTEIDCIRFDTVQIYNVNISKNKKNSALSLGNGIFETASSGQVTSENGCVPEIVDDFTKDANTHFIPLMGPKKKQNDHELITKIKESVRTNSLRISGSVPKKYIDRIEGLLVRYRHCISISQDDVGELPKWSGHVFRQEFESEVPVPCTQYKCPPAKAKFMCEQISELVKLGVCRPFQTYVVTSNILSVPKRDGTLRLVCDLRHVNKYTKPSNLKLARADDIVEGLLGYRYYSSIDHAKGYWNLPLAEDQQSWYSFQCAHCYQTYVWARCVMGARNSSTVYSYMVSRLILEGLEGKALFNYIDDTMFGTNCIESGLKTLEILLRRLCKYNLRIGLKKMNLFSDSFDVLGYHIDQNGLHASADRLAGISNLKTPENKKTLLSGLASMNYHRQFIKGFAHKSALLWKMTSETGNFNLEIVKTQWAILKKAFENAISLSKPDFDKDFILMTDASDFGIGCTLYQDQNGKRVIVGCFSKGLTQNQLVWSIANKELLAVKTGLEQFERWIENSVVHIYVDNVSVYYMLKLRLSEIEIQKRIPAVRFLLYISTFTFSVHHISGKDPSFLLTDFLSRHNYVLDDNSKFILGGTSKQPLLGLQALVNGKRDQYVNIPIYSVELDFDPNNRDITKRFPLDLSESNVARLIKLAQIESAECRKLINNPTEKYRVEDDSLFIITPSGPKLVVPKFYSERLVRLIHNSNHESSRAMILKINRMNIFIFNKYKVIDNITQQCNICDPARSKGTVKISSPSIANPRYPFDIVHIDLSAIGPIHILVCVDSMTRFLICRALQDSTSKTIRDELTEIFSYFGLPGTVVVDNAANLNSSVMDQFFDTFGILKSNSSVMRSQANSLAENGFSRIQRETRKFGLDTSNLRYLNLQLCVISYKLNLQRSPGRRNISAFEGMFSRYSPWVGALPDLSQIRKYSLENNLKNFYDSTLEIREQMMEIIKTKRNKALGVNKYSGLFKVGDYVRIKNVPLKGIRKKLHRPWTDVVFEVIKIVPFTNTMILRELVSDIQYQPRVLKRHMGLVKKIANHKIDKGDFAPILDEERIESKENKDNRKEAMQNQLENDQKSVRTDQNSHGQANKNSKSIASKTNPKKGKIKSTEDRKNREMNPTKGKIKSTENRKNTHGMSLRPRR